MRKKTTNSSGSGPELPLENIEEATVAKTGTAMNRNAAPTRAKTMIGTRVPLSLPSRRKLRGKGLRRLAVHRRGQRCRIERRGVCHVAPPSQTLSGARDSSGERAAVQTGCAHDVGVGRLVTATSTFVSSVGDTVAVCVPASGSERRFASTSGVTSYTPDRPTGKAAEDRRPSPSPPARCVADHLGVDGARGTPERKGGPRPTRSKTSRPSLDPTSRPATMTRAARRGS